jgi:hypothetical protein
MDICGMGTNSLRFTHAKKYGEYNHVENENTRPYLFYYFYSSFGMINNYNHLPHLLSCKSGDGKRTRFLEDKWTGSFSLAEKFDRFFFLKLRSLIGFMPTLLPGDGEVEDA